MEHGKENIYIVNRKGFIKYALQHGYVGVGVHVWCGVVCFVWCVCVV
jgi:hypothetical protein